MDVALREKPDSLPSQLTWWVLALPAVLLFALVRHDVLLLNWVHVLAGVLWTGADIFMGFILGPVLRRLDIPHRTAVIRYLVPRTLLYFPAVSFTAGTAGWYLASWLGMTSHGSAQFPWIISALVLITLMAILGFGILLPNSLRIWLELQKPEPNRALITGLNRYNIMNAAIQGVMQIAIIAVMARLTMG